MTAARHPRGSSRGMTLLEVMVSVAILAMISLLIYGAFDSLSRGKKGEALRADRAREGREAVLRIVRDVSSTFLSLHAPQNAALLTRTTAFIGEGSPTYDRLNFTAFAHRRFERDAHESDQCEVGYFAAKDPDVTEKMDLVRREQTPIDMEPKRGGVVNLLVENIEEFHLKYLDPMTTQWLESWDTTQISGQPGRLPLEVQVTLKLKALPGAEQLTFTTKFMLPMQLPLSFGITQ